MQEYLKIIII